MLEINYRNQTWSVKAKNEFFLGSLVALRHHFLLAHLFAHHHLEMLAFVVVSVLHAKAWVYVLLGENLEGEFLAAAFKAAQKWEFCNFGIVVAEDHVASFEGLLVFLLDLSLLDIAVKFAILGDGVSPEFLAASRVLTHLEFNAFFLFVFGELHIVSFVLVC